MRILQSFFVVLIFTYATAEAQLQINPPFSMPDVNIIQVGDKAYAFCGTDLDPFNLELNEFIMPYWRLFSSNDLINWSFESYLDPALTWMGKSDKCFAGHGIKKGDTWYWYFSNYTYSTGVVTGKSPKGPWKDPLEKPLLPENISITKEYDACVFTDNDKRSYIIFGSWVNKKICYHVAELNEDMISLKEAPRQIQVDGIPDGQEYIAVDAPFMHKHNGLYYLSWRKPYAVSKNIYGPFRYFGLQDAMGHGGFFSFNNQDFVNYTTLKKGYRIRYRFSSLAYVNYNMDGTIAPIEELIKKYGVGQYDSQWPAIEAEWFMSMPDGPYKNQTGDGRFVVMNLKNNDYLYYPNINNCPANASAELNYSSGNPSGGTIMVKASSPEGPVLGTAEFSYTGSSDEFKTVRIPLGKLPPGTLSLCFVFTGEDGKELLWLDSFKIIP